MPLVACGAGEHKVQWEEEVATGQQLVWVRREDTYTGAGEPGNPLQPGWRIRERAYAFSWQGREYKYKTSTSVSLGALRLHIDEAANTVSIIDATRACAKPGYAEFRWTGKKWEIQRSLPPALIGVPRNLMAYYSSEPGAIPGRVTRQYAHAQDRKPKVGASTLALEAANAAVDCTGG